MPISIENCIHFGAQSSVLNKESVPYSVGRVISSPIVFVVAVVIEST